MTWLLKALADTASAWGAAQERADSRAANRIFDQKSRLLSRLRKSPEEVEVLRAMISSADVWCQFVGATFLWPHDPAGALAVMERLAEEKFFPLNFSAEQTAIQMRDGTLNLTYVDKHKPASPPPGEC